MIAVSRQPIAVNWRCDSSSEDRPTCWFDIASLTVKIRQKPESKGELIRMLSPELAHCGHIHGFGSPRHEALGASS